MPDISSSPGWGPDRSHQDRERERSRKRFENTRALVIVGAVMPFVPTAGILHFLGSTTALPILLPMLGGTTAR